jgi:hypothetical protein
MSLHYDKMTLMTARVAGALAKAVLAHGVPNSFGFSELVGRADAMTAGKAVRAHWATFCLNAYARGIPQEVSIDISNGRLVVREH